MSRGLGDVYKRQAQNIMDAASKGVFCLSAQRTMALIFVESAMSFRAKKRREFLKK